MEVETDQVASTSSNKSQEQFLILAKSAHGAALRKLIEQELEAPDIYVFGELLELTCVQEVYFQKKNTFLSRSPVLSLRIWCTCVKL